MRILAISDLHVRISKNRELVAALPAHPNDWLILAGDIGESPDDLLWAIETLRGRFARLIWVPGNHELWTVEDGGARGERRYMQYVELCRAHGVLTPEDPYVEVPGAEPPLVLAPLFLLYDYSFHPPSVATADARAWAEAAGIVCTDEFVLHPDPFASREAWCHARCAAAEGRLAALPEHVGTILVNHFPLRIEHAVLPRVPPFSIWCGTTKTSDWHRRFRAHAVVFGHLHIRQHRVVDGVPFHEVSLGYPRQWTPGPPDRYLRQIWPPVPA